MLRKGYRVDYEEIASQPYSDAVFSGGFVTGHPIDTVYLRWQRAGDEPTTILMRPDELAAIMHIAAGVLWSCLIGDTDGN